MIVVDADIPATIPFSKFEQESPENSVREASTNEDVVVIHYTSGTTGKPKGAMLSHKNLLAAIDSNTDIIKISQQDRIIVFLPLFHVFTFVVCILATFSRGTHIVLLKSVRQFKQVRDAILRYRITILVGIPQVFNALANANIPWFFRYINPIRVCVSGGAPLTVEVLKTFEQKFKIPLLEGYGLSESSPIVSAGNLFGESPVGTIGMPMTGTDWGIFDAEEFEKGPIADGLSGSKYGEENTGEICVCGPQVMKGYLNQPIETADTLKKWDGRIWLLTGDIGCMNDDGTIAIRDRKKQLIKVAGHSVFPAEVESLLMSNEAVSEAAVAGLPDPKGKVGEITKAWVALKPEYKGKITEQQLIDWTEKNMTKWKCPAIIEFIDEVPKNIMGKVQRRVLQEADPLFKK